MTSSVSRACVHSAWIVYIADRRPRAPSTLRSGQATAAPVASGRPLPMAPPVSASQSCGGAPTVAAAIAHAGGDDSSTTIAWSGIVAPTAAARLAHVEHPPPRPVGDGGRAGTAGRRR